VQCKLNTISAISWREQVIFQGYDVHFVLEEHS